MHKGRVLQSKYIGVLNAYKLTHAVIVLRDTDENNFQLNELLGMGTLDFKSAPVGDII